MKMMPLIMLSCSRTLAMLGAVNCATRGRGKKIKNSIAANWETGIRHSNERRVLVTFRGMMLALQPFL